MATYRPNPSNKEQNDLERFHDHSAIRVMWFDGQTLQTGTVKNFKAYDLMPQDDLAGSPNSASLVPASLPGPVSNRSMTIGSWNDRPWKFDNPGKA